MKKATDHASHGATKQGKVSKRLKRWLVLLAFVTSSLFILFVGETLLPENSARYATARTISPVLGSFYQGAADQVTIVRIDDDDLSHFRESWPVSLRFHARRLAQIAEYQPKAIFVDLLFLDQRPQGDVDFLADTLCAITENKAQTRVVLASLRHLGKDSPVLKTLFGRQNSRGEPCVLEGAVEANVNAKDLTVWSYPLAAGAGADHAKASECAKWQTMAAPRPACSAALALYQLDHGAVKLEGEKPQMALVWGATPDPQNAQWMQLRQVDGTTRPLCRSHWQWTDLLPVIGKLIHGDDPEARLPLCPQHLVVPLRGLMNQGFDERKLSQALGNHYVMYGVSMQSASDLLYTPLHGWQPGVHLHAMALDNLLAYGQDYKRDEEAKLAWPFSSALWLLITSILLIIGFMYLSELSKERLSARCKPARDWLANRSAVKSKWPLRYRKPGKFLWALMVLVYDHSIVPFRKFWVMVKHIAIIFVIAVIGHQYFNLGPVSWVPYAFFFALADFFGLGKEMAKRWERIIECASPSLLNLHALTYGEGEEPEELELPEAEPHLAVDVEAKPSEEELQKAR